MDNTVNELLKESNLLRNNNCYFTAAELKIPKNYMLYEPFIMTDNDEVFYTYIINYTEEGFGVLPMCDGVRNDLASFIPIEDITEVTIDKGLFYNKVYIIINKKRILSFRLNKKDTYLKVQKDNVKKFLEDFIKKDIENK